MSRGTFDGVGGQFGSVAGAGGSQYDDDFFEESSGDLESFLSVEVTLRIKSGVTAGVPDAGFADVFTWTDYLIRAYVYSISQEDVFKSGGFYQMGDVILGIERQTAFDETQGILGNKSEINQEGNRVTFRGLEYRIVGFTEFHPFGGTQVVLNLHLRKLGLP